MLKGIFSFISLAALMVTAANFLVERGFSPESVSSEKILNGLVTSAKTASDVSAPKKNVLKESKKSPKTKFGKPQVEMEVIELSESDFIPDHKPSIDQDVTEVKVTFTPVKKTVNLKKEELLVNGNEEARSELEKASIRNVTVNINGSEPIKLYGFKKGNKIKETSLAASFRPIQIRLETVEKSDRLIATNKENKIHNDKPAETNIDRISTGLAATEKSVNKKGSKDIVFKKNKDATAENEELVYFDYSKSESHKQMVPKSRPVKKAPEPVVDAKPKNAEPKNAIASPVAMRKGQDSKMINEVLKSMGKSFEKGEHDEVAVSQAQTQKPMNSQTESDSAGKNAFLEKNMNTQNHISTYKLSTQSGVIGGSKKGKVQDFEIRFADDINDIRQSDANGNIVLRETLNSSYAVRRGTIMAGGHYATTVDFTFENQEVNSTLPLITQESFNNMLDAQGLTGLGGQVLVQLDELTEDVELGSDAVYEKKIYLDRGLRVVERTESDFNYILFVGVEPGNKIISFKTYKREVASKIIHVAQDEIYFDFNFYASEKNDEFELFEDHLLSKESAVLTLSEKDLTDLQYDSLIEQLTLNRYQVKRALYPVGTRKYFELKHMKRPIYIGRWSSDYVDVPSQQYRDFALSSFGISQLEYQCMVQINIEKQAMNIDYDGKSFRGPMVPEMRILDTDGIFYKDLSDQSRRVFLLGEMQGALSVKIDYVDGSTDYLQTFCSAGGWVVEQL